MRTILRILVYLWVLPTTAVGLVCVMLGVASGGRVRAVDGVLEVHGGLVSAVLKHFASAMTLGHVVLGVDAAALEWSRSHERIHVQQCERWGPFFLPAYLGASLVLWLRGKKAYWDNPFEREAYAKDGR